MSVIDWCLWKTSCKWVSLRSRLSISRYPSFSLNSRNLNAFNMISALKIKLVILYVQSHVPSYRITLMILTVEQLLNFQHLFDDKERILHHYISRCQMMVKSRWLLLQIVLSWMFVKVLNTLVKMFLQWYQ